MSVFGDYEPEDAWQPDDPPLELILNLLHRLLLLLGRQALLDAIEERLDGFTPTDIREALRAAQLYDDLDHVRSLP